MVARQVWSDEDVLQMFDLHEGEGLTATQIGSRLRMSRSAVLGILKRVRDDLAESERGSDVRRPENMDGAMGRGWWRRRRAA